MKQFFFVFLLISMLQVHGQEALLKTGDRLPDIVIGNIINAPVKEINLNRERQKPYYILNFWGTWCSPCIPEMDTLATIQKTYAHQLQVIAISDDDAGRKQNFLKQHPSAIWLATDTAYTLYKMLNLAYVGQSAIIGPDRRILALVRTDSISHGLIKRLLSGKNIPQTAGFNEPKVKAGDDPFGVDSFATHSFSIRGFKKGQASMGRTYMEGPFKGRRASFYNVGIGMLYRNAYGIKTYLQQELYDASVNKDEVNNSRLRDTAALYCVDILVPEAKKDSLYAYLQQYLNQFLPVKVRVEERELPVYVLKKNPSADITFKQSLALESSYGFSGRGYAGTKVTLADFATDYLSNELGLPVVDESGIQGYFDINTTVHVRNVENVKRSVEKLGLMVEQAKRMMKVLVYYR